MKKNINLRENETENKVMPKEQQIHRKKKDTTTTQIKNYLQNGCRPQYLFSHNHKHRKRICATYETTNT